MKYAASGCCFTVYILLYRGNIKSDGEISGFCRNRKKETCFSSPFNTAESISTRCNNVPPWRSIPENASVIRIVSCRVPVRRSRASFRNDFFAYCSRRHAQYNTTFRRLDFAYVQTRDHRSITTDVCYCIESSWWHRVIRPSPAPRPPQSLPAARPNTPLHRANNVYALRCRLANLNHGEVQYRESMIVIAYVRRYVQEW